MQTIQQEHKAVEVGSRCDYYFDHRYMPASSNQVNKSNCWTNIMNKKVELTVTVSQFANRYNSITCIIIGPSPTELSNKLFLLIFL